MRMVIIIAALVVIAGGVWYYLGMPGYEAGTATAVAPAATDAAAPAADSSTAPASPVAQ